jgi:hypothetical protein
MNTLLGQPRFPYQHIDLRVHALKITRLKHPEREFHNNKRYLRIGAISLFGVTLLKLFVYDITNLDTISKTIVFVALGILLLIISFLYKKYKHLISDETDL